MATHKMYAYGRLITIVCGDCEEKPCRRSWSEKNDCPKIVAYNEKLGQCCATCMRCICLLQVDGVSDVFCIEKAGGKKVDANTDFSKFLIKKDIFTHSCKKWTNTWEEEE